MTTQFFLGGKVELRAGDCRDRIREMPDCSIDSIVTDPPYALVSIQKRFGKPGSAATKVPEGGSGAYARASSGFMGKQWDTGETAFSEEFWAECLRVLKPGGHVVAFSGTRTYHRMVVAIEDAGFEIRDQLAWVYGSGFPKSHDVSKGIDKALGAEREKVRVKHSSQSLMTKDGQNERPWQEAAKLNGYHELASKEPASDAAREWQGWGTALKPSWEPIVLARKPLAGTVATNVLEFGTGALNVDGCRVGYDEDDKNPATNPLYRKQAGYANGNAADDGSSSFSLKDGAGERNPNSLGRWPANIIHDSSDEIVSAFPDTSSGSRKAGDYGLMGYHGADTAPMPAIEGGSGSVARFFYSAKADKNDRMGSKHPTVKPVDLMQWLVRLVTPKGGVVLDPFAGSGSTGEAAWREGMRCILVEREEEYQADIAERLRLANAGPSERRARAIKQAANDNLPLFGAA